MGRGGRRRNSEERSGEQRLGGVGSFPSTTFPSRILERPGSFLAKAADRDQSRTSLPTQLPLRPILAAKMRSRAGSQLTTKWRRDIGQGREEAFGCPQPSSIFHPKSPSNSLRAVEGQRQQLILWRWGEVGLREGQVADTAVPFSAWAVSEDSPPRSAEPQPGAGGHWDFLEFPRMW